MNELLKTEWLKSVEGAGTIVIKIGSAVISDQNGLARDVMANIAFQIATLLQMSENSSPISKKRAILVSSGAVAAGRTLLYQFGKGHEKSSLPEKQAIAAIGQTVLMSAWADVFRPHGLPVAQILLTRDDFRSRERFLNIRNTFSRIFGLGVFPIVNENDTVSVSELKFGDNDCLASLLVNLVEAELFINLTSASGVRAENPQINPSAPYLRVIEDIANFDIKNICGEKTSIGSGGMHSKLLAARRVAQLGVGTLILPGKTKDSILAAFNSSPEKNGFAGTWVRPGSHPISRRKFWLAYQSSPQGALELDSGAVEAIFTHGASLLPGGIRNVEGVFAKGAIVEIKSGNQSLGVGLSNYNSATLQKIIGHKRHEVAALLGQAHYPEVIHRDNLLLDAAL